jgi:hypothetical protein
MSDVGPVDISGNACQCTLMSRHVPYIPFELPIMKYKKFGSQLDMSPYSPGMVAIFAYARDWGIKRTPTVMPASVSFNSHRGLYFGSQ